MNCSFLSSSVPLFRRSLAKAFIGLSLAYAATCQPVAFAQQNAAYNQAQTALRSKDYAEAARLFYTAVTTSEGATRDKAEFGLAEALRRLNLPYSSAFFHARIVTKGSKNDFFRHSFESISSINARVPLGKASVAGIFETKIDPLTVPPNARGFFFFYRGLDHFDKKNIAGARADFSNVPAQSPYYGRAQYYLGVIHTLNKDLEQALSSFNRVARTTHSDAIQELAILNMGRVHYEKKDYRRALSFYAQIPRNSDLWLQSLFEGAWAFFMMQRHNNALGNVHTIHSPFFQNRFFPETHILNAITYLRLCKHDQVRKSLKDFQERYRPTFADLRNLLMKYQGQPAGFYNLIARYRAQGGLREYPSAAQVIDSVSRSDAFKDATTVVRNVDRERAALRRHSAKWEVSGLAEMLRSSLDARKAATIQSSGEDLYAHGRELFRYLLDLSDQTQLINLDRLSSITDELRSKFAETPQADATVWGEGMRPLSLKDELEYWPFQGEWWEDELGGYVYNIESSCGAAARTNSRQTK